MKVLTTDLQSDFIQMFPEVVQTACSSSLVALVRGVHALRLGLCDVAVCGGVSFSPDEPVRAVDGMIWAADGVCRPFSDDATGTAMADGGSIAEPDVELPDSDPAPSLNGGGGCCGDGGARRRLSRPATPVHGMPRSRLCDVCPSELQAAQEVGE